MIETSNPEIDVNELMERVRQEAARVGARDNRSLAASGGRGATLPAIPEMLVPPAIGFSQLLESKKEQLEQTLQKARGMIEISRRVPKLFRGFFRRQGGFNRAVLEALKTLAKTNVQLNKRVRELMVVAEQQQHWLRSYASQGQTQAIWMKAAAPLLARVPSAHEKLNQLEAKLAETMVELQAQIGREAENLRHLQGQSDQQGEQLKPLAEHLRNLQGAFDRAGEHLRNLQGESDRQAQHLQSLQERAEAQTVEQARAQANLSQFAQLQHAFVRLEERQTNDSIYVKGELALQSALLHQSRRGGGTGKLTARSGAAETVTDPHRLDTFYLSFENRFRGSRSEIKERVRFYLPLLKQAKAGTASRPILDVGCGRGEWLELLQENGLQAAGVDLNSAMVAQCAQRDLAVTQGDAIQHLRSLPDKSVGAVSGFHIIEHLPLETLIDLIVETRRVLKPGGLAIFESPNCKNLTVGACNFNIDPTHRNPIFPETAQFMLETHGFEGVRLEYLSPSDQTPFNKDDQNSAPLTELLYGPQDFAVVGRKPTAK